MPTINVNYYHRLRELSGRRSERMHMDEGATVNDLKTKVLCQHPSIMPLQNTLLLARNNEYVAGTEALNEGDVVDVMPPVSGG